MFLLSFYALVASTFADTKVQVVQPLPWANQDSVFGPDGTVPSSPALFGVPPAGRVMVGQVYVISKSDTEGCVPFEEGTDYNVPAGCTDNQCVLFYMVDRGDCNFVEKVRHVQQIGGHAAIIVDNVNEDYLPFMADDGTGGDIVIPSVLISNNDGQKIKSQTASSGEGSVVVKMTWSLPNPDGRVEWSLWSTPTDTASSTFKTTFGHAVAKLGDAQQFTPHFIVLDGVALGCTSDEVSCGDQCINGGRYCAVDPEDDLTSGLTGADNLEESLRQLCFFNVVNSSSYNNPLLWWSYVTGFQNACIGDPSQQSEDTFNQQCSFKVMSGLGVNTKGVQDCLNNNNNTDGNGRNELLEKELQAQSAQGVRWWPLLFINKEPYVESLQCPAPMDVTSCGPLNMICAGYQEGTAPCACTSSPGCDLCEVKDTCGVCIAENDQDAFGKSCEPGLSAAGVVIIVLVCFIIVGVVVVYYMRNQQQKMRDDIDNLLSQYQPLDERMKAGGDVASQGLINGMASDDV